ncbi:MAG: ECF transporter S component [Vallitaleaceae bacterium]|jgi:energy-coupling factor transport system substrate-specific component|nr:ECF transporter S component [Vallitaleaceae bacterium]
MEKSIRTYVMPAIIIVIVGILTITTRLWLVEAYYMPIAFIIMLLIMVPRFIAFERSELQARETILIAIFAGLATVARIPFAGLPSIQPTSSIIILSALIFGPNTGFMVGAIAALASNVVLGQGPWTPWQMFAWGMMGYIIGQLAIRNWVKNRISLCIWGFTLGILYGWVMNLWFLLGFVKPITWASVLTVYGSSFYFDLMHGLSNAILIYVLYKPWHKVLGRIQLKYGLINTKLK